MAINSSCDFEGSHLAPVSLIFSSCEDRDYHQIGDGHCTVMLVKVVVLLLSVRPLLDQDLLPRHPNLTADLPTHLPQAPASDCSYPRGGEGRVLLLVSLVTNEPT